MDHDGLFRRRRPLIHPLQRVVITMRKARDTKIISGMALQRAVATPRRLLPCQPKLNCLRRGRGVGQCCDPGGLAVRGAIRPVRVVDQLANHLFVEPFNGKDDSWFGLVCWDGSRRGVKGGRADTRVAELPSTPSKQFAQLRGYAHCHTIQFAQLGGYADRNTS